MQLLDQFTASSTRPVSRHLASKRATRKPDRPPSADPALTTTWGGRTGNTCRCAHAEIPSTEIQSGRSAAILRA